jgi:hypothetical protein
MEGKESVDAKTLAQDDRFIRAVAKCEGIIGKATQERVSLLSFLGLF